MERQCVGLLPGELCSHALRRSSSSAAYLWRGTTEEEGDAYTHGWFDGNEAPRTSGVEPCPCGADKPEPTCTNRHQCWEPCGELGKSAEHVRVGHTDPEQVKRILGVRPVQASSRTAIDEIFDEAVSAAATANTGRPKEVSWVQAASDLANHSGVDVPRADQSKGGA
jgi:hypothetical protein